MIRACRTCYDDVTTKKLRPWNLTFNVPSPTIQAYTFLLSSQCELVFTAIFSKTVHLVVHGVPKTGLF